MCRLNEFFQSLENYAPLRISLKMIENGDYDNSGILVKCNDLVEKVLFSLDLSKATVERAIELGCDTIVTHHPAIYQPIKSLSICAQTAPVTLAIMNKMNVISMHLNLDMTRKGIDHYLASAVGGKNVKILDTIEDGIGYGREFDLKLSLEELVENLEKEFRTDKIICYGQGKTEKIATFCGGGASYALNFIESKKTCADTIITSDMPHHVIKELIERDKKIIILPHYVSEEKGFNEFYAEIKREFDGKIEAYYFDDKRFR